MQFILRHRTKFAVLAVTFFTLVWAVYAGQNHGTTIKERNGSPGLDFDSEFITVMVNTHQAAIKLFEKQPRGDENVDARASAAKSPPASQRHRRMDRTISSGTERNSLDRGPNGGLNKSADPKVHSNHH